MQSKEKDVPKVSSASTKKELLEAFNMLKDKYQSQAEAALNPEKEKKDKKDKEVVQVADTLTTDTVINQINQLKSAVANALTDISGKLEEKTILYQNMKSAIDVKNRELNEIYEIDRGAFTLAALIEAEKQKKNEFEAESAKQKPNLKHR